MRTWQAWLGAGLVLFASAGRAAERSPADVVRTFNTALLDVLKRGETLGYRGRFQRLEPVMREAFDFPFMAEKSLGTHWKALDEADRARWVAVFTEFSVANFAANFDRDTGQTIAVAGEEPGASDTRMVRTRIATPGAETVEFAYRLRATGARWAIVDVYLKGTVSELALRRSDYASTLEREGFEGLVAGMRGKIADLAAGRAKRHGM